MNAAEFNERIVELTTRLKPKNRKNLCVEIGNETAVYLQVTGIQWDMIVPVGCCQVHAGSGRRIEVRPSWHEGMMQLAIGDTSGHDFRVRGYVEFHEGADIELKEVGE